MNWFQTSTTKCSGVTSRRGLSKVASQLLCPALLICSLALPGLADDWPQFRGPQNSSLSASGKWPVQWTLDDAAWSVELPGAV